MRVLFSNMLRREVEIFLVCCAALTSLIVAVDSLERLPDLLRHDAQLKAILAYYSLRIPQNVYRIIPLVTLIATLLTLGLLNKHHEITAMRSFGISSWQIAAPFVTFGLVATLSLLSFTTYVVPLTKNEAVYIENVRIKKQDQSSCCKRRDMWVRPARHTFMYIEGIEAEGSILRNIELYRFDSDFQLRELTRAKAGRFTPEGWILESAAQRRVDSDAEGSFKTYLSLPLGIAHSVEDVRTWLYPPPSKMTLTQLGTFIDRSRRDGYSVASLSTDYWERISFPFAAISASILGVALGLKGAGRRDTNLAKRMGQALGILFLCWVIHTICLLLGRGGMVPPVVGAWSGMIMLFAISIGLFLKVDRA